MPVIVYDSSYNGHYQEYDLSEEECKRILKNQEWLIREAKRYGRELKRSWRLLS